MIRGLAVVLLLAVAAAGGYLAYRNSSGNNAGEPGDAASAEAQPAAGEARLDFTLPDLQGAPHSLEEWRGKTLLVNFWATWCAPCRREIPLLKAVQAAHGREGLQVVGIAVDYAHEVATFAATAQFNYPVLVGQEAAIAAAESAGIEFLGLPFTLVVAPDGRLVKVHIGELHAPQLEQIVAVTGRLAAGEIDLEDARETLGRL